MGSLKILRYIIVTIFPDSFYIKNPGPLYLVKALLRLYLRKSWNGVPDQKRIPSLAVQEGLDHRFLRIEPNRQTCVSPAFGPLVPRPAGYCPEYVKRIRSRPYDRRRIFFCHPLPVASG